MPRLLLLAPAVLLVGCAASQQTTTDQARAEIASARSAVSQAEQADADTHAATILRGARQKLEEAASALATGQTDLADRLAEQAAVDARLAETRSRAVVAETAVAEVREAIEALRNEIERNRRN